MKRIILLLLIFSSYAFSYSPDQINFSEMEYRRYIKPQIRNILHEYTNLFFLQNNKLQNYKPLLLNSRDLLIDSSQITTLCSPTVSDTCEKALVKISKLLFNLKTNIEENKIEGTLNSLNSKTAMAINLQTKVQDLVELNLERITNASISNELTTPKVLLKINSDIKNIYNYSNLMLIELSDEEFKNHLNNFWTNFIKPLQFYIMVDDNSDFLKTSLTKINISFHELKIDMTKRNKDVSQPVRSLLNTMESRWRSVLKILLK